MMRECPYCGGESDDSFAVCPRCGRPPIAGAGGGGVYTGSSAPTVMAPGGGFDAGGGYTNSSAPTVMLPGGDAQGGGFGVSGSNDDRTVMLGRRRDGSAASACFLVTAGPDKGEQIELGDDIVLGRGAGATVRLSDRRVSEMHAQVKRVGGQYIYQDLLSTNGSHLIAGGRRVLLRESHILADADEIELGHTVLRFIQMDSGGRR